MKFGGYKQPPRPTHRAKNAMQAYEMLKAEWIERNPSASSEQYAQAMRAIARKGRA